MARAERVFRNLYRDSVSLMQLSAKIGALAGVRQASAVMATAGNLDLLRAAGLARPRSSPARTTSWWRSRATTRRPWPKRSRPPRRSSPGRRPRVPMAGRGGCRPSSLEMALTESPGANLALISTPGDYAAAEAMKALRLGLQRHAVQRQRRDRGRDRAQALRRASTTSWSWGRTAARRSSTASRSASPTSVRRGEIGVVARVRHRAAGGHLPDRPLGRGHLAGDRHRRPRPERADRRHHDARRACTRSRPTPAPGSIVLISKPPAPEIAASGAGCRRSGRQAGRGQLPRRRPEHGRGGRTCTAVRTLEDAAGLAVALAGGAAAARPIPSRRWRRQPRRSRRLAPGQRYVRGLFSGGTFCYEALLLLSEALGQASPRTRRSSPAAGSPTSGSSEGHTVIDLGDDVFTRGRPHPMIDPRLRIERLAEEAADPEVAVILFDVVLGYGAHADPAAELGPAHPEAQRPRPRAAGARSPSSARSAAPTAIRRTSAARRRRCARPACCSPRATRRRSASQPGSRPAARAEGRAEGEG